MYSIQQVKMALASSLQFAAEYSPCKDRRYVIPIAASITVHIMPPWPYIYTNYTCSSPIFKEYFSIRHIFMEIVPSVTSLSGLLYSTLQNMQVPLQN
jgi:hypothetical protein